MARHLSSPRLASQNTGVSHLWCCLLAFHISLLVSCGPTIQRKPRPTGVLSLHCEVADAEVWIDGRYYREVAELRPFRLGVGDHRIEVRHSGYHSMYYEVTMDVGNRQTLDVELAKRLP